MASDEEVRLRSVRESALQTMGLVVLLERAGGNVSFTESEYKAVLERLGGPTMMAVHIEISKPAKGGQPTVELTLVRKPPANAELMS